MGNTFGGGTDTTKQQSSTTSSSSPWAPQATQVQNLLGQAGANYAQQAARGPYSGSYVAGENPYQSSAYANEFNNAGYIQNGGNAQVGLGNWLLGNSANAYSNNAQGLFGNSSVGPSAGLSGALNSAGISGAQSIQSAQQQLAQNAAMGASDPTARLTGDAQSIMSSAPVQSAINSTNANIDNTLATETAPGLDRAAAMGGSLNSSRAGAAQATAAGQAALAKGSADASIQNNAFNQGLGTALSGYESGLNASNSAAASSGYIGNSAALGVGGQQLAASQDGFNNGLYANQQIGQGISYGNQSLGAGAGNLATGAGLQTAAGQGLFGADQNALTNQYDQYQGLNNYGTGILGQYQGLIQGNYGMNSTGSSTGTNTQTQNGSVAGGILGLGLAGAGLYSGFGGSSSLLGQGLFGGPSHDFSGGGSGLFGIGGASLPLFSGAGSGFGSNAFNPAYPG